MFMRVRTNVCVCAVTLVYDLVRNAVELTIRERRALQCEHLR